MLGYWLRKLGEARLFQEPLGVWEKRCADASEGKSEVQALAGPEMRASLTAQEVGRVLGVTSQRVIAMKRQGQLHAEQETGPSTFGPADVWRLYLERKSRGPDLQKGGWRKGRTRKIHPAQ